MISSHVEARNHLADELESTLIGPGSPDEILEESPISRYLTGILYPQGSTLDPDEDSERAEADQGDDPLSSGNELGGARLQSTIGMTFILADADGRYGIRVRAGRYLREEADGDGPRRWRRVQVEWTMTVPDGLEPVREFNVEDGLRVHVRSRPDNDRSTVTVMLINDYTDEGGWGTDPERCFLQPQVLVHSDEGGSGFVARRGKRAPDHPPSKLDLLYRYAQDFATGHGCATDWDDSVEDETHAIRTSFLPRHEVPRMLPSDSPEDAQLSMLKLATGDADDQTESLKPLLRHYGRWIEERRLESGTLPSGLQSIAETNLDLCDEALQRMREGLRLLQEDARALDSFRMANRAMYLQRVWSENSRGPERLSFPEMLEVETWQHCWYPFQIAFILLVLPSIVEGGDDRELVDLLWFPTGGGKTEAYLGLVAFTIFYRRLREEGNRGAGVTAIMRYTLRLLTLQQFQRASAMICACELIRRGREDLGGHPISIGLWVGGEAVPNNLKQAAQNLQELKSTGRCQGGNPVQLRRCPACGERLTEDDYHVTDEQLRILCPNADCEFGDGLPAHVIDDDVYRELPSLLIGTVDKFARLPWKEESGRLFSKGNTGSIPPELIVQDELHLIAGPLGSLVGLYETAVDLLASNDGRSPKVIASTATIQRASEQVRGLFGSDVRLFPPAGLDARDNFFAREVPLSDEPGRLYLGTMAPGRSMKTALVHAFATLLQRVGEMDAAEELKDPYWTLVGYFNSIRELGGTIRLIQDDIPARMDVSGREDKDIRSLDYPTELYSGVDSENIPMILEDLFREYPEEGPVDVLLATSMISVGVDIDRLSSMVVAGQPKASAEYIQATSRIGRKYPGLVLTVYNWARPRDRSHFERFKGYHQSLYRAVEASSVTPFSSRARDKGLHGVLVSLVRHTLSGMSAEQSAHRFDPGTEVMENIASQILDRVKRIDPGEVEDTRQEIVQIIERWKQLAEYEDLRYGRLRYYPDRPHLLYPAEAGSGEGLAFPTLNSLRNVEPSSSIYLVEYDGGVSE